MCVCVLHFYAYPSLCASISLFCVILTFVWIVCMFVCVCLSVHVKVLMVRTERLMGVVLRAIVSHSTVSQGTLFMHGATYAAGTDTQYILPETLWGCVTACLCAYKRVYFVCIAIYTCQFMVSSLCTWFCFVFLCVCVCVHAREAPVTITAHRGNSDLIHWFPSLTCRHPTGHVVYLHTVALCSLGSCSHKEEKKKILHFHICM